MKKLLSICISCLLAFCAVAQNSRIVGKTSTGIRNPIYIFEIINGAPKLLKSTMSDADGSFILEFAPAYEGFYLLGGFTKLAGQFPLYIKKEEQISLKIDNKTLVFADRLSAENQVLQDWNQLRKETLSHIMSYFLSRNNPQSSIAKLKTELDKVTEFRRDISMSDKLVKQNMDDFVAFDLDYSAFQVLKPNLASAYQLYLAKDKLSDDAILKYPRGRELLVLYADQKHPTGSLQIGLDNLKTERQKALYLLEKEVPKLKTYAAYEAFMQDYGRYMEVDGLREDNERLGAKLLNERVGATGSAFSLPDPTGKNYGLKDFKGKVVLINVWATYCAPCKVQMPFLEQLKEKMKSHEDMVFVGVAFDGPRALETWKKMIVEKNMTGLQLFGGGGGNLLAKDYGIKVMPRYLLFDREGRLVTANAPAPGTPSLEKMLLETLKNK